MSLFARTGSLSSQENTLLAAGLKAARARQPSPRQLDRLERRVFAAIGAIPSGYDEVPSEGGTVSSSEGSSAGLSSSGVSWSGGHAMSASAEAPLAIGASGGAAAAAAGIGAGALAAVWKVVGLALLPAALLGGGAFLVLRNPTVPRLEIRARAIPIAPSAVGDGTSPGLAAPATTNHAEASSDGAVRKDVPRGSAARRESKRVQASERKPSKPAQAMTAATADSEPVGAQASEAPSPVGVSSPSDVELVSRAQRSLKDSPGSALQLAGEYLQRAPRGSLAEEAEVIAIRALVRLGRTSEARARAQRFASNHPGSTYLGHLRTDLETSSRADRP